MKKWFEIFRTGTHTALDGKVLTYTESDLDAIVSSYDPAKNEAPMVVGHPKLNHPAFGWVKELKREGDKLLAYAEQIVPEFAEMVNQGLFKKRSIALNADGTLRHVGFLGAVPPAVKGLADVEFGDGETADGESFEFSSIVDPPQAEGQSQEDKPANPPKAEPKADDEPVPPSPKGGETKASTESHQNPPSGDDRLSPEEVSALKAELAALKAERAQEQAAAARAEFASFIDGQMREGRVVPKLKEPLMKMYDTILSTGMEFAEGSNPVQQLREVIQSMPKHLLFSETPAPAHDPVKIDPTNLTQMAEMAINNS